MADTAAPDQKGLYCSTSGTFFTDKDALADHYKSDFHRYNLKRKIANLPPVTREWFEARKEKLASTTGTAVTKIWLDPLTKKKFSSENTYKAFVNSKKYKDLVKQSGKPAPEAAVSLRRAEAPVAVPTAAPQPQSQAKAPYTIKAANGVYDMTAQSRKQEEEELDEDDESGWETASDEDEEAHFDASAVPGSAGADVCGAREASSAQDANQEGDMDAMEEWDVRRSLFDGHVSRSMEANLEYMWKKFGFYFPEADLLTDPEGLLKYLGAKLQYGRVPLYVQGDDANARQFPSLHAVQRHMTDTGRFKMAWEDNEEEYAEFYDFGDDMMEEDAGGRELALAGSLEAELPTAVGGYELVVGGDGDGDGGGKVLGHRQFARYYRQKYRAGDPRHSVAINRVLAQYHLLGIATQPEQTNETKRQQRNAQKKFERMRLKNEMRANVNRNLPRNVPY